MFLGAYEQCCIPPLRNAAVENAYKRIVWEDENTECQTLSSISKMMHLIARYHVEGTDSYAYRQHEDKRRDFMWIGGEGMMMNCMNGSQLWDIAFITQSLVETGLANDEDNKPSVIKALQWLDRCQIRENPKHFEVMNRHRTKGAWPFSTKEQGYTVSDCTGEGLKSVLYLQTQLEWVISPCRPSVGDDTTTGSHPLSFPTTVCLMRLTRCCRCEIQMEDLVVTG